MSTSMTTANVNSAVHLHTEVVPTVLQKNTGTGMATTNASGAGQHRRAAVQTALIISMKNESSRGKTFRA